MSGVPARIQGLRRPILERVLSESMPIRGSVKTSDRRASIKIVPSSASGMPSSPYKGGMYTTRGSPTTESGKLALA